MFSPLLGSQSLLLRYRGTSTQVRSEKDKFREPVHDGQELLERRETVEDPRKSEGTIDTCYEFSKPVGKSARLEV